MPFFIHNKIFFILRWLMIFFACAAVHPLIQVNLLFTHFTLISINLHWFFTIDILAGTKSGEFFNKNCKNFSFSEQPFVFFYQLVGAPLLTDVTLICNVEASPKAINYWQRENGKLKMNFIKYFFIAFSLFHNQQELSDFKWKLMCMRHESHLHVYFLFISFLSYTINLFCCHHQEKKLISCVKKLSSFFLIPLGEMIISNDRYQMTEAENSMYAVQMTLVIRKLQKTDMGGYKCISKNSIGDAEGTIRIYGEFQVFSSLSQFFSFSFYNCNL